ncbi:hypothetical protein G6F57_007767 [Rhizopus arrhizus]|uniref:Uncharacterized protein n=1 Tax=Rhizopus oryzae TaxID=64495 RepID=A0A9P7BR61_RHIOR|nr:hypothetical protein G6F23_002777 [Rhizopus arrhizus]KAG1412064.1 hypothetical protein G6F58_008219 [Rhizopus delemar]KAG0768743.1 hypothetical protein G6F24_001666 [Rhizopus arrhizus]KAG0782064.1 hypothetical protein G6F22_009279 [Rhizopus arrhizus]KAG0791340.1 hypothetical protein G6F21_005155 [Rhizopus arrhizus]
MDYMIDQNKFTVKTMMTEYLKIVAISDLPNVDKRIKRSRYPYKGGQTQNEISKCILTKEFKTTVINFIDPHPSAAVVEVICPSLKQVLQFIFPLFLISVFLDKHKVLALSCVATHLSGPNVFTLCALRILTETLPFVGEMDVIFGVLSFAALAILLNCKITVSQKYPCKLSSNAKFASLEKDSHVVR